MNKPYIFDEFFASGLEESVSPFLSPASRKWGKNLSLKSSFLAALFLILAFVFSFFYEKESLIFLCFVYFLVGVPSLLEALSDLKNLEINIDVLMTVAAFASLCLGSPLEGGLLLVLFNLSHAMEDKVSNKTKSAIHLLHKVAPKTAFKIQEDGQVLEKSILEIVVGDHILIKNGEVFPLDGKIVKGSTTVNLKHITGESTPIFKTIEDEVPAGAVNLEAAVEVKAIRTSDHSTLSKIIHLVTEAQEAKPKLQSFIDRFGGRYATSIMAFTFLSCILLPTLLNIPFLGNEGSIYRSLSFLIAASPCALILALPTAYLSAISASAQKGILLKGGAVLDSLEKCRIFAFDKTGTLTLGELVLETISPLLGARLTTEKALSIALGLEIHVKHPIAESVQKKCLEENISAAEIQNIQNIPGFGIVGSFGATQVCIGKSEFIFSKLSEDLVFLAKSAAKDFEASGKMLSFLLIGQELFILCFTDKIRPNSRHLIEDLKKLNIDPIMLTGDHNTSAQNIGKKVGIEQIYSNLKPEDKLEKVALLSQKHPLAMIGDGMNDAPSLARASVGISMGKVGSQAAIDSSDIVLLHDDIQSISWLYQKAKKTKVIVMQNLTLALGVIILATIPALLGFIPLWLAVILHEGGTVIVGLNSLRLLRKNF